MYVLLSGKRGVYTGSSGLKVGYISGVETKQKAAGEHQFNFEDVKAVNEICTGGHVNFQGVDILLTSQWPKGVSNLAPQTVSILMYVL